MIKDYIINNKTCIIESVSDALYIIVVNDSTVNKERFFSRVNALEFILNQTGKDCVACYNHEKSIATYQYLFDNDFLIRIDLYVQSQEVFIRSSSTDYLIFSSCCLTFGKLIEDILRELERIS